jgi:hypothetical protein
MSAGWREIRWRQPAALALAVAAAACTSPEATRMRGGGPGGDPGNRTAVVQIHEGARPYEKTPAIIGAHGMQGIPGAGPAEDSAREGRRRR